jgi:hypothetical protein
MGQPSKRREGNRRLLNSTATIAQKTSYDLAPVCEAYLPQNAEAEQRRTTDHPYRWTQATV